MTKLDEVLEVSAQILIRCAIMGILVLFIWWGAMELFGDLAYSVHSRMFPISRQQFELVHYTGMLITKSAVGLLFIFPYIAVRLVLKNRKKQ